MRKQTKNNILVVNEKGENLEKIEARIKVCGTQKISTLIFNQPIYKGHKGYNQYGRNGKKIKDKISKYKMIENITDKELKIIENTLELEQKEIQKENRVKTIHRNTTKVKDLVLSNIGQWKYLDKFLTLTFRTLPKTIHEADYQLQKFIKKIKYHYGKNIQYLVVRELQKENERNGIHYHIFLFNCPFIKHSELLYYWNNKNPYMDERKASGVNIQAIKNGLNQVINYLTGYTLKDLTENDDFLQGHKILLKSKGLKKPYIKDYQSYEQIPFINLEIKKGVSYLDNKLTYLEY